jgi:hypothetical protein
MHLDEERVQRMIHGELPPAEASAARHHAAGCTECGALLEKARRDEAQVAAALLHLDHPPAPVTAESVMRRARAGGPRHLRRAAAIVFALAAAGAAYAAPGSPVPEWIERVLAGDAGTAPPTLVVPVPRPEPAPPDSAGIAVAAGTALTVAVPAPPRAGFALIVLVDGTEVAAHTAGAAAFTAGAGRILVETRADSLDLVIAIPRTALRVDVVIGGRRLFRKDGPTIETGARADAQGRWVLPFRSR